jgi:hypothetical protein
MRDFSKTRRQLLRSSAAWVGGLAALAAARPAGAAMQQVKVPAQSPLGFAIANRCKVQSADHDAIRARLTVELAADQSLGTLTERCPLCGCPVTVSR